MSDCKHLFLTSNTNCVHCNKTLQEAQIESGNAPEAQGTERATPASREHQHVFQKLGEPCVVCHESYESVVQSGAAALVVGSLPKRETLDLTHAEPYALTLTGETELVGLASFLERGGIVYCNRQALVYDGVLSVPEPTSSPAEKVSVASVRQALRFVAFYGGQLAEDEQRALVEELSLAGARLRALRTASTPEQVRLSGAAARDALAELGGVVVE